MGSDKYECERKHGVWHHAIETTNSREKNMKLPRLIIAAGALLALTNPAAAQIAPAKESLTDVYPGKAYSPYAQRGFPSNVYWGDTHLHTGLSMDAGLFGARLGLDEAYRFARGEEVMASSGQPAKLGRPLDWLVIADHSDGMGFFTDLAAGDPDILKFDQARRNWATRSPGCIDVPSSALLVCPDT